MRKTRKSPSFKPPFLLIPEYHFHNFGPQSWFQWSCTRYSNFHLVTRVTGQFCCRCAQTLGVKKLWPSQLPNELAHDGSKILHLSSGTGLPRDDSPHRLSLDPYVTLSFYMSLRDCIQDKYSGVYLKQLIMKWIYICGTLTIPPTNRRTMAARLYICPVRGGSMNSKWGSGLHGERGARAYIGGLGALPQWGPEAKPLVGVRGLGPEANEKSTI